MECQHPADERYFNDDCLLEWCGMCGQVVADHHKRKYNEPHPDFNANFSAAALGSIGTPKKAASSSRQGAGAGSASSQPGRADRHA